MKIVLLERNSVGTDVDVSCYTELGSVTSYENTVTIEEVRERVADADIAIINKAPMRRESLESAAHLKLICVLATGYDNCDIAYCAARGIQVRNVVDYCTAMVAQHTFTLALALSERLAHYDAYIKSGAHSAQSRFSNFDVPFRELDGKTWGIVGMGSIGQQVATIAGAFGCHVIYHSLTGKPKSVPYERVDKQALLMRSDFLSLHCPLSDLSRHFISENALGLMKRSAILLNMARGPVVDQRALYHALTEGQIGGAGLDVLEKEPLPADDPMLTIQDSNRLLITPHLAWASVEARERCVAGVYENILAFLRGEERNLVT